MVQFVRTAAVKGRALLGGRSRRSPVRPALLAVFVAALGAMGLACESASTTFVVNSIGDGGDAGLNGTCRTSAGTCTLRAAIQEANHVQGHNAIHFSIGGTGPHRIAPGSQLPVLTDGAGATIDGYTQPGSSPNSSGSASNAALRIELKGQGPYGIEGLVLWSPGNVIRGLAIWNFKHLVRLDGAVAHDNVVVGNFIGLNAAGLEGATTNINGSHGVALRTGAHHNRIGRPGNADRNVISGNYQNGIAAYNDGTDANVIQNNIIGLRPDGAAAPNRGHGIDVNGAAAYNIIGGTGPGERNIVSGNRQTGVEISHGVGTDHNQVVGNSIGTTVDGNGVQAHTGNGLFGVDLEGVASCSTSCPRDAGFNTVNGNVIVNNTSGVMIHKGQHDNVVTNNRIGVLPSGAAAGNENNGVAIEKGAFANRIGPGNLIAHNSRGVVVVPYGTSPGSTEEVHTYANRITRNSIRNNAGLGIDLAPVGSVTPTPSLLVNNSARIPLPVSQTSTQVTMSTCAGCTVELFLADGAAGAHGEGRQFLTSAVADSSGTARLTVDATAQGQVVTATATNQGGNSSEFSQNVLVPR